MNVSRRIPEDSPSDRTRADGKNDSFFNPVDMDMIVLGSFRDCEREAVVAARQVGQLKSEPGRKCGARGNRRRRIPTGEICAVAEQILAMLVAKHETDDRSRQ